MSCECFFSVHDLTSWKLLIVDSWCYFRTKDKVITRTLKARMD